MQEGRSEVEINGRVYDAKSGKVSRVKHSKTTVSSTRKVMDGVIPKNAVQPVNLKIDTSKKRPSTSQAAQKVHTPKQGTKRLHPAAREAQKTAYERTGVIKKFSSQTSRVSRINRAKEQTKSRLIKRHNLAPTPESVQPQAGLEDRMAPPTPMVLPGRRPKVDDFSASKNPQLQQAEPPQEQNGPQQSWARRHLVPAAASFTSLALISGFLIYNSLPTLTMRVAASRAGFNATVPNYQPSGFSFEGPVSSGPGRVVLRFDSKTDDRVYTITEKESSWDSQSLLDNFVLEEAENYLTFEEHGLTVYLYDSSQATWIDDGVWYVVEGDANLNSEQLLKIAASL